VNSRIPRQSSFEASLECGPVRSCEVGAVQWVVKGSSTVCVDEDRQVMLAERVENCHMHRQNEVLDDHNIQDIGDRVGIVGVCGG
jgi:hypothetical protein